MYVAEGAVRILHDEHDLPEGKHQDDWTELQGLLCARAAPLYVQHIPGHAKWDHADQDIDGWFARWNDRADREANMAMRLHGEELLCLHRRLLGHHERELSDLLCLQRLHAAVANVAKPTDPTPEAAEDYDGDHDEEDWLVERGSPDNPSILDGLPDDESAMALWDQFGKTFVVNFLQLLRRWDAHPERSMMKISFLELAIHLAGAAAAWLPQPHMEKLNTWCERGAAGFSEPTIGALVRLVKAFTRSLTLSFCLETVWCKGINLSIFSVFVPQDGLILAMPPATIKEISTLLISFTRRRPIRRANDLSRPLRSHSS